jgi:hypothetical protein
MHLARREWSVHMHGRERHLTLVAALLLCSGALVIAGCGRTGGGATLAARGAAPTATVSSPAPTATASFIQIIATLGPTPFTTPGDSSARTPTPPPPHPTATMARPTPSNTPIPPTATPTPLIITIASSATAPGVFPASVTVPHGTFIVWHNATGLTHTATRTTGPGTFDTGFIGPSLNSNPILFATPGTYTYQCSIHPTMTGTIIVT